MPRPCASARAPRTAWAEQQLRLAVVLGVRPQLERDRRPPPRPPRTRAARPPRSPRRRSSPRACDCRTGRGTASWRSAQPSARCSASAASSAAWRLAGVSPPSSSAICSGADPRRLQQRSVTQQRDDGAARGDRRATAARVETRVCDAVVRVLGVERQRDADQIAAGRPAGGARVRAVGDMPACERSFEMLGKACCADTRSSVRVLARRAGFVDGLLDREGVGEAGEHGRLAVGVDDQDRRRLGDLDGIGDRAERADLAGGGVVDATLPPSACWTAGSSLCTATRRRRGGSRTGSARSCPAGARVRRRPACSARRWPRGLGAGWPWCA